jgi:peroxiredoxin
MDNGNLDLQVGQQAPDFTLDNEDGEKVTLSDLRGQPVVLAFYPFDWSGTCTKELCSLRDNHGDWASTGATVYGISRDSKYSHKAWKEHLGLNYSLLADLVGEAAKKYGVWDETRHRADRVTFVIDPEGIVRYVVRDAVTMSDHAEALQAVRGMAAAGRA